MILRFAKRALGFRAERRLARYDETAGQILALASDYTPLSASALRERADELRHRAVAGTPLDNLTIETFALVREAARRALSEQHVAAQLIGGLALHDGCIAEMKTGEGKTLTATLVCALNALPGHGVHVASPNDYLAERDANWMRPVYQMLGLSVGVITSQMDDDARREAYRCDITYGVASEFGFDYLRDNMKFSAAETVQRGPAFALVDEADAVLIDEAGMPLALYGPLGEQSGFYRAIDAVIAALQPHHYEIDDRRRVALTEAGYSEVEQGLRRAGLLATPTTLHDIEAISLLHHVVQALRAHVLLARDRDYIVHQHDGVVIIDKLTGRPMPGRRYDEGLHQALEAKENCAIGEETRTLASITFQTLFRRYTKLAGMTGTATADDAEYRDIYGLEVVTIPTHRPLIRVDEATLHSTAADKLRTILHDVESAAARGQPVLIGAPSIEQSETLAAMLEAHGWKQRNDNDAAGVGAGKTFAVLNAKHYAREARIIAQAGAPGAVTIATAMAGRGTDIRLGGETADAATYARVIASGGLLVIGTAHHDHCRLDDQLRGRAGRQGDPGRSVFHASLQDDLLNTSAAAMPSSAHGSVIASPVAHRLVRAAQKRHESRSFDRRLSLLRFDAIIQRQRDTTYDLRRDIRDGADPLALAKRLRDETIDDLIGRHAASGAAWDIAGLDAAIRSILTLAVSIEQPSAANDAGKLAHRIRTMADHWMQGKIDRIGEAALDDVLRRLMMALIDQLWSEQSERLEHLKRSIGDRRLPPHKVVAEFQIEAFALFELMTRDFRHEVTAHAMRIGISTAA